MGWYGNSSIGNEGIGILFAQRWPFRVVRFLLAQKKERGIAERRMQITDLQAESLLEIITGWNG